jgi:O-antigen ligase
MMFVYPKVVPRLTAIGLVLAVILGSTIFANQIAFAWERLNTVETAEGRIIGGAKSVQMIEQKPVTGWGYDTYDLYDEQFRTRVGNLATDQEKTSHNTWLTIMAEQGIPAFLLYMFPTVWWLMLSLRVWRRLPENGFMNRRLLALLWLLILGHLIVSSFMDMVRFNLFGTTIYWMALGIIASMVYPYLESGDIAEPKWTLQPARSD